MRRTSWSGRQGLELMERRAQLEEEQEIRAEKIRERESRLAAPAAAPAAAGPAPPTAAADTTAPPAASTSSAPDPPPAAAAAAIAAETTPPSPVGPFSNCSSSPRH